ncbi:hypothetical protein [Streptomyces netropsis]|uniref:Glycosyltransferase RgtA/B/C/D-like domain-containing protein n=1 Tax=Streptomyces netropsis TaxID=55404 RepID=A0A7W7PCY9_STRNE|nr:hypothetical protein [Streptomyces netropsis]MBB4885484.1 hypothetical protein [Streptomyces netropsis]GGR38501.1 hypothetical protein GCM10010219_49500 [Streptomyces netropsis]
MRSARLTPGPRATAAPEHHAPGAKPLPWLAGLAAVHTLAQLVLVIPGLGLGWDETVYLSQVSPQAPAAFFSAPRARGITFLVAPVAALTTSTAVLRGYLALASGGGLLLSLWVWRRLLPLPVLVSAGVVFSGLWITLLYGPQVMPNLWVAYGALLATGCFLRAVRASDGRADRRALFGLAAGVAFTALMRPGDAMALMVTLAAAALCVRPWRRPAVLLALVAGAGLGSAEWIVEAYLRYGDLAARVHRAGEIQGGITAHLAVGDQLRALEGRTLCRPCDVPWRHPVTGFWWLAVLPLTAGGLLVAARTRRLAVLLLPALVGLALAVPYQFIDYAAPRFLLPAYALLSLPVALCLLGMATAARPRALAAAALALALSAHFAVQYVVLHRAVSRGHAIREGVDGVAAQLRRQGVRAPCLVTGAEAVRVAFRMGCASRQIGGHDGSITLPELLAAAERRPVVLLVGGGRAVPAYARDWRVQPLPRLPGLAGYRACLSPRPVGPGYRDGQAR